MKNYWSVFNLDISQLFETVKCYIVDMDGTFYLGSSIIEGSLDFTEAVKKAGKRFFFYTNNSSHNSAECAANLKKVGYEANEEDIIISSHVTIDFLKRNRAGKSVYLLGNENLTGDFIKSGIELNAVNPDIVVLGFDTTLTYEKIRKAAKFLAGGAEYIATHPDCNCPTADGFMPDTGSMMAMLEASTGRRPDLIMGKPYGYTVDYVTEKIGCSRDEIAFIGDRLETDIAIGMRNNLRTLLVYSGVTSPELYERSDIKATAAVKNLCEFAKYIK